MKYALDLSGQINVSAPSASGAIIGAVQPAVFVAWQPSTWPAAPGAVDEKFINTLKRIFEESMLGEIRNVIEDAHKCQGDLTLRGHVVALALMCALDTIASYGYKQERQRQRRKQINDPYVARFIKAHFRADYHPFADHIYKLCRCSLVHSWNLFEAAIYPDDTKIKSEGGVMAFGLLDLFTVLVQAAADFLNRLEGDATLQKRTLARYSELKATAKA